MRTLSCCTAFGRHPTSMNRMLGFSCSTGLLQQYLTLQRPHSNRRLQEDCNLWKVPMLHHI